MTSVGGYVIDRPIARGRSGTVYRATAIDGSPVALKIHERRDEAAREAACLEQLDHQGLASLIDADTQSSESPWLALRWIPGTTLQRLLSAEGPLTVDRVRDIVDQLADALTSLHRAGFVHGDLSPSNILIGPNDQATVLDFASAHPSGHGLPVAVDHTTGLEIETTPQYTSPEVARGNAPTTASDVYALAIITYEALTGQSPFPDVATPIAMLAHHASTIPDPPSEHRPGLAWGIEHALLSTLAKNPNERPESPVAFAELLRSDAAKPPGVQRPSGRPRGLTWAMRCGALIAVALAAFFAIRSIDGGSTATPPASVADDESMTVLDESASAGSAAALACNLITAPGFEVEGVPDSYYSDDPSNTTAIAAGAGVSDSAALRVGANGAFGIFGEIVPLGDDRDFVFSAFLRAQGEPQVTTMYVDYLDSDYQEITSARDVALTQAPLGTNSGGRLTTLSSAPAGASFAVPTFFKDSTGGSLLVDEVVFAPEGSCAEPGS